MSLKSVSIRIEEDMLEKILYIATYEGRSINSHILVLIRENILNFKDKYKKIGGEIPPDANVKVSKKSERFL